MANMSMGDRNSFERATIGTETLIKQTAAGRRWSVGFVLVGLGVLAALSWAMVEAIHGWDHIIVIADIVIVVGALAAFLYRPGRDEELLG